MAEKEAVEAASKSGEKLPEWTAAVSVMAESCVDVFLLENAANVTDNMRAQVLAHYMNGVRSLTGMPEEEAAKFAKRMFADQLALVPIDKTIFATEPAVTTAELQAVQADMPQLSELVAA